MHQNALGRQISRTAGSTSTFALFFTSLAAHGRRLYAFFVFGFVDNLKGPTLPALLRDLDFSYGQGGTILFGAYLGFMVATLLTGVLADAAGIKVVLLVAGVRLTVGLAAFSLVSSFWLLAAALFVVGLGLAPSRSAAIR